MAAFTLPFDIVQGETYNEISTWKAGDPAVAVNLTGCTARLQVRSSVDSSVVLLELTTALGGIVLGGIAGTVQRLMSAEETEAITWTCGVYDLEIILSDLTVRRLMEGHVNVSKEVTRV